MEQEESKKATPETYSMVTHCKNCGQEHVTQIVKGNHTFEHQTKCPYCGIDNNCDIIFRYKKPPEKEKNDDKKHILKAIWFGIAAIFYDFSGKCGVNDK